MDDPGAQWTAAMREGRFGDALALGDRALAARDPATRDDPSLPYHRRWVWDGRSCDGHDVLVRCYHGLGDTIQFARYLPALASRARSVSVEAPARLHGLLRLVGGVDRLLDFDHARPATPSTCDVEITELPQLTRIAPDALSPPYLAASPAALPAGTVGICHAAGDWDMERHMPAALLRPLCAGARCITLVPEPTTLPVANPQGCPFDLDATAALVAACDLVVTVDTMIAHLAGALARPVWLMLKAAPDWRWDPASTTSVWYPTARLYVQRHAGDWRDVAQRVAADLTKRKEEGHEPRRPAGAGVLG